MSRSQAREYGFKLVYQYLVSGNSILRDFFKENKCSEEEKKLALDIFSGVKENKDEIDKKISLGLKNNLKLKDIFTLDHAILQTAISEIDYLKEDKALIIDSCVKIAKKFSTLKSPSFINAVLSSIYSN